MRQPDLRARDSKMQSFRSSKLKLSPIFFLAVTGLVCTSPAFTAAQNSQCPEYSQRTVDPRPGRGGNNTPACLQASGPPCANLSYALSEVDNCLKVLVTSDVVLTAPVHISDVQGLVLAAEPGETITVSCEPGADAGLYLEKVNNTEVEGMAFENCSVLHPSAILVPAQHILYPNVTSALYFERCVNVSLDNCSFISSRGSGVTIFNSGGQIAIQNSFFTNNSLSVNCSNSNEIGCYNVSVGLEIKMTYCELDSECSSPQPESVYNSYSNYLIRNCTFYGNNNSDASDLTQTEDILSYLVHRTLSHGGGVEIRLEGVATRNTFTISDCNFTRNIALWGGGLEVGIGEDSSHNTVSVISSVFHENSGLVGGGLRMGVFPPTDYDGYGYEQKDNVFAISNSTFERNTAVSAGAISYVSNAQLNRTGLTHLEVTQCHFISNRANTSGAAVAISAWNNEIGGFPTYAEFTDCSFKFNHLVFEVDVTQVYGLGVVNAEQIPVIFTGNTSFLGNAGSAVVASSTVVVLNGSVDFENNWSINGAAIVLISNSWIKLMPGVRVTFSENEAFLRGGAIYSDFFASQVQNSSRYCIFRYSNNSSPVSEWDAVLSFSENRARLAGPSIFISTAAGCYKNNVTGLPFTEPNVFHYTEKDNSTFNQVGSPPKSITFGPPASFYNGSYSTNVSLGRSFNLHPVSNDFFNSPTSGTVLVSLICNPRHPDQCNSTELLSDFRLVGEQLVQLNNSETTTAFSIHGPANSIQNETILLLLSNTLPSSMGYLHINATPCNLGYTYNSKAGSCDCIENDNVACGFSENNEVCIKYGYWIGYLGDNKISPVVEHCQNSFCNYNNGHCPAGGCIRTLQSYCRLPDYDTDRLCAANRGGLLCSSCKNHYAFTYAATQCVPEDSCSAGHTVLLVLLIIIFWAVLIAILLAALKLGFQIGSGYLYCLIYYFSVLEYLTRNNYPSHFLEVVVSLFSGFLEVNPRFFGLIPVCIFGPSFRPIYHKVLEFIHPLFIFLVILLLIVITRRFPRLSRMVEFDGTKALCILLYLSFTSLVETSLSLLHFIELGDESDFRVSLEPTVHYFDPILHLPWALLAIAVLLVIAAPFIFLLLVAPTLSRHVNLTRVKPILDQYQSCYQEKYRWFAGYYLICRVIVFIFSLINLGEFGSIFFLQMISIVILVVHAVIQPYRKQWLNVIDSILLADLAIYSLFNGSTANVVLGGFSTYVRDIIVHVLILTPVGYFLGLCFYKLYRMFHMSELLCSLFGRKIVEVNVTDRPTPSSPLLEEEVRTTDVFDRESLIYSQEQVAPSTRTAMPLKSSYAAYTSRLDKRLKQHTTSQKPWYRRVASSIAIEPQDSRTELYVSSEMPPDVHKRTQYSRSSVSPPR